MVECGGGKKGKGKRGKIGKCWNGGNRIGILNSGLFGSGVRLGGEEEGLQGKGLKEKGRHGNDGRKLGSGDDNSGIVLVYVCKRRRC